MARTLHEQIVARIPAETKRLVQKQADIADRIFALIKRSGKTQRQIAEELGMKPSFLSRILAGESNLTLKTIARFEVALGSAIVIFKPNWLPE